MKKDQVNRRFNGALQAKCLVAALICLPFAVLAAGEPAAAPPAPLFQWRPFLGPFHSLVLHYPIGFLTLAFILEVLLWRRRTEESARIIRIIIWLSLISGLFAAGLGIMRASGGDYDPRAVQQHFWSGLAVPVATLLSLYFQIKSSKPGATSAALKVYRFMLVITLGLVAVAGHMGGNLTHGSNYLIQNAPRFLKQLLEGAEPLASVAAAPADEFTTRIRPILENKCFRCHGPEKQRGKLRLDVRESALKGGDSGKPAIKPGDAMGSNLVRMIMLPADHEDVMPPKGKEPLSAEETIQMIRWIQAGAKF